MDDEAPGRTVGRPRGQTRARAQQVALELFTRRGYETTSMREIAEELGIQKASLYHHFSSKEAILRSLFVDRADEAGRLLAWLDEQDPDERLVERAVLRWVGSFSADKLRGIRFMAANPLVRHLQDDGGPTVQDSLTRFADRLAELLPHPDEHRVLLLRMSILSINAAVEAAAGTAIPDAVVLETAVAAARALVADALDAPVPAADAGSGRPRGPDEAVPG